MIAPIQMAIIHINDHQIERTDVMCIDSHRFTVEITDLYNNLCGTGNWLITPTSDLPADFSVDTYTIINNALVPASPEIIAQRQAIQAIATHEAIRLSRQQRYDSEAITSLYWNWQESGAKADKAKWLAAKEAIRQELPYAEQAEQHEKGGER